MRQGALFRRSSAPQAASGAPRASPPETPKSVKKQSGIEVLAGVREAPWRRLAPAGDARCRL